MAGAYCKFCGQRCFVSRQVIVAGELVWSGHMATCHSGKEHDRKALGMDASTAHNPVWNGCTCPSVCGPTKLTPGTRACINEQEPEGDLCTGTLTFALGDPQAKCPACGAWMGRLAPGYEQDFAAARRPGAPAVSPAAAVGSDPVHGECVMTAVYGQHPSPGIRGTRPREVWWALSRAARAGQQVRRGRQPRPATPFIRAGYLITEATPRLPYGRSTAPNNYLTHLPVAVLFAWQGGVLAGHMVAWRCGARTAYFRFLDEPDSTLCPVCLIERHNLGGRPR